MSEGSSERKNSGPLIAVSGWIVFMIGCGFMNRFVHYFNQWQFETGGAKSLLWAGLWLVLSFGCLVAFVCLLDISDRHRKRRDQSSWIAFVPVSLSHKNRARCWGVSRPEPDKKVWLQPLLFG